MKTIAHTLCAFILLGARAGVGEASLIKYEGFAYSPGSSLTSQPGWVASGSGDSITAASGNLAVTNIRPPTGNLVTFAGGGEDARLAFTPQSTNTYFSFAFRMTDLASLDSTGGYFASFSQSSSNLGSLVWVRARGSDRYDVGGSLSPTSAIQWNTNFDTGWEVGRTMYVIGCYVFVNGINNDVTNIWLSEEPFIGSYVFGGPEPGSAIQVSGGAELSQVSGFTITQHSSFGTPAMQFDELRIGKSFAEVTPVPVPEPSTIGMSLIACVLGLGLRLRMC